MPTLYILAGPNGAGKTTFYQTAVEQEFIPETLPFINIDSITKDELGGYTESNFIKAEEIYRQRIGELITNSQDFMIESNLAKDSEYGWIEKMKQKGFDVVLYYLCTDYPDEVHVKRVQERVAEGGHDVPENIVHHRYRMSLLYLKSKLHLFKEVYLIDNEDTAIEMATLQHGQIIHKKEKAPHWVQDTLSLVEKISNRKK
jgi:predicted ABC-type ATPase